MRKVARLVALGSLGLFLGGCALTEGGSGVSDDSYKYVSTAHQPKTVTLLDTRSGEPVMTWDIKVGEQLVLQFAGRKDAETTGQDELRWSMGPVTGGGSPRSRMTVPPPSARRLDLSLRTGPEYPAGKGPNRAAEAPAGVVIADSPKPAPVPAAEPAPAPAPAKVEEKPKAQEPMVDLPN